MATLRLLSLNLNGFRLAVGADVAFSLIQTVFKQVIELFRLTAEYMYILVCEHIPANIITSIIYP